MSQIGLERRERKDCGVDEVNLCSGEQVPIYVSGMEEKKL